MSNERTLINLRGYCFYCLKKISNEGDTDYCQSPGGTPVPPSPLSTPLRTRCHNVHSLPPGERLAPFTDLCRFLGVELPDCYAFGDGSEPEVLYPPLCEKCHELSARLCILQDELQYIQTRIQNTVERIHRRVTSTIDSKGAIKREQFNNDFRRKSKGSLSRGRGENLDMKKVTDLLKAFQVKIIEKDHENRERKRRRATNVLFPACRNSFSIMHVEPMTDEHNNMENEENIQPKPEEEGLSLEAQDYLPPEETLRSRRCSVEPENEQVSNAQHIVQTEREICKPYPDISTIVCDIDVSSSTYIPNHNETSTISRVHNEDDNNHLKTTLLISGVTTRSRHAREQLHSVDQLGLRCQNSDDDFIKRRRIRRVAQ